MLLWSYIGEGAFRCSLNLSPNVLAVSPMYSSLHSNMSQLYLYITPLFLVDMIFIFGCHKFIFDSFSTFEMNFYAISFAQGFEGFTKSFIIWNSDGTFACGSTGLVVVSIVSGNIYFCFHSVNCPHWILAKCQCFLDLFLFFL